MSLPPCNFQSGIARADRRHLSPETPQPLECGFLLPRQRRRSACEEPKPLLLFFRPGNRSCGPPERLSASWAGDGKTISLFQSDRDIRETAWAGEEAGETGGSGNP